MHGAVKGARHRISAKPLQKHETTRLAKSAPPNPRGLDQLRAIIADWASTQENLVLSPVTQRTLPSVFTEIMHFACWKDPNTTRLPNTQAREATRIEMDIINWCVDRRRVDIANAWFAGIVKGLQQSSLSADHIAEVLKKCAARGMKPSGNDEAALWFIAAAGPSDAVPALPKVLEVLKSAMPPRNPSHIEQHMKFFVRWRNTRGWSVARTALFSSALLWLGSYGMTCRGPARRRLSHGL
jgi:hypothetical protein